MEFKNARELVLAYHHAFHQADVAAVRRMLKNNGKFIGPLNSYDQADEFLKGASIFIQLSKKSDIKEVIAEGDNVCVLYDYQTIVPSIPAIPIASWFRVEEGKISFFHTHFNPIPFLLAKEKGDVDRALETIKKNHSIY